MASNVPKFASFRPKPKVSSEPSEKIEKPSKLEERVGQNYDTKRRVKHDQHERSRKAEDIGNRRREERADHSHQSRANSKGTSTAVKKDHEPLYFIDRKGDKAILTYGALDARDTPAYRRHGYGSVLGLPSRAKIDRESSTDKALYMIHTASNRKERLLTSKHGKASNGRLLRIVKGDDIPDVPDADFISFSTTGKRKRDVDAEPEDYRSIHKTNRSPSPDLEYDSDHDMPESHSEIKAKNSRLIRQTRDHPEDLEAWLSLIEHHHEMMALDRSTADLSSSDRKHLADIRIQTYENAIRKSNSNEGGMIKLYVGLMAEASNSWDNAKLTKRWEEVLAKFPHSLDLWIKYLDFIQGNFKDFKYEICRTAFQRCLKTLLSGPQKSPDACLQVMLRLTAMISDTGYQELAQAIWQALLELHFLRPPDLSDQSLSVRHERFEEFWDSEVPRIGEAGAKGWRNFDAESATSPLPGPTPLEHQSNKPTLGTFGDAEAECMEKLQGAGRTTHEVGEDDPFHLIFFSDIAEFVQLLPLEVPDGLLLDAFLCFNRLPPLMPARSHHEAWQSDPFLHLHFPNYHTGTFELPSFAQTVQRFRQWPMHIQMTTSLLIDYGFRSRPSGLDFVHHALKLLIQNTAWDDSVGEYLLALELNYFPAESFKTAKQLLQARPSSLRLYNAYGLVESRRGKMEKSEQVFNAALSMQPSSGPLSTFGSLHLFSDWVWEALRNRDDTEALLRLISPRGKAPSSASHISKPDQGALLRTRSMLQEGSQRSLLAKDYQSAVLFNSLLALLTYLSGGHNVGTTLQTFENLSNWFLEHSLSRSIAAELLAQSIAQFLTYHVTHATIVKPSLLRTKLDPLISRFPSNTLLLSLYAANEARFSIDDRVRGIVREKVLRQGQENSITGWQFAIQYEIQRGEVAGSTNHSIRSLFIKAEDDVGAHCPALWRSHVLFELAETEKERARRPPKKSKSNERKSGVETRLEESIRRVRDTFFQGMTNLPWCKEYMMLAFTHLNEGVLSPEELRKVYNVMVEKELRIYIDLDVCST